MDSPQMYDTHSNQQNGAMSADMKKATGGANSQPPANPNTNNNNNNNLTTLNNNTGTTKQTAALLKQHHLQQQYHQHGELSELNSPEISLDLQNLIDDTQFSEGLFTDLINPAVGAAGKHLQNMHPANRQMQTTASGYPRTTLAYMPQPVHSRAGAYSTPQTATNSDSNSSIGSDTSPSIKEEPVDPQDYRRQNAAGAGGYLPGYGSGNPTFTTLTPGGVLHHQHHQFQGLGGGAPGMKGSGRPTNGLHPHHQHQHNSAARKGMKPADKSSDEYRRRRERNNIAVRKSREKAKVRTRETEEKVKLLVKENDRLQKRIELLTEELNVLRSLFSNVGVLPEHLHREINKHLDTFQLQHQQQQQHMTEDRRVLDILQEYGP